MQTSGKTSKFPQAQQMGNTVDRTPSSQDRSSEPETFEDACARMLSCFSRLQLFKTLWAVARQAPLSIGFSGQEYWNVLPCPPPGDLPGPEIELSSLTST